MLEVLFEAIVALIEGIMAVISVIIESIAGLFTVGGEALGAGEALMVLFLLIIESIMWFFLFLFELLAALFLWRKPKKVKKPILYRKKKQPVEGSE